MGFLDKTLKTLKSKSKGGDKEADKRASKVSIDPKDGKDMTEQKQKDKDEVNKDKVDKDKKEIKKDAKKDIKKEDKKKEIKEDTKSAYKVLIKPLVSEKAAQVGKLNQYIFVVDIKANKQEIKKAVNAVYGVKPIKVNVIKTKGKTVRFGRTYGKRKDFKKAIVTLPKGKSIQIYEGT